MVMTYIKEIDGIRPEGPIRVGGMCQGCLVAMEIARRLPSRQTGPVILADPPAVPAQLSRRGAADPRSPQIAQQMYRQARTMLADYGSQPHNVMPFNFRDSEQMHTATLAA